MTRPKEQAIRPIQYSMLVVLAAALIAPQVVDDQFVVRLAIQAGVFILLASAHNLLMKVGLLSLGPVAFYGLGAYVSAILTTRYEVSFLAAFFAAGIAATVAGWIIGRLTLRLRTAYFVLVTLGFAECFRLVALNWIEVTNGPMGIAAIPPPAPWFTGYLPYYYFILLLVALVLFGLYCLEHSTIGRGMLALRENEMLAQSVGISSYRYMMLAALLSSFIMGLAGSFYAHFFQFLGPEILVFDLTITIVVMVIAGGRATLAGPVLGAILFTVLPELLRTAQEWRMAIFGLLLMIIMLFMPDGIFPTLNRLALRLIGDRLQRRPQTDAISTPDSELQFLPERKLTLNDELRKALSSTFVTDGSHLSRSNHVGSSVRLRDRSKSLLVSKDLCVYFGGVHAVERVDLEVKAGEILAIIGPNGAGKTTMLNAITGFGPVTSGKIWYQDKILNKLQPDELARQGIVRTFQQTSLFLKVSVRDNLILAHTGSEQATLYTSLFRRDLSRQIQREAEVVADCILEFIGLKSHGALLAGKLPYGSQRLLELGIALASQPQLLLLDEPAAGLNPAEVNDLIRLIGWIRDEGITVVLVEHDMKLVMGISDRVVVLDDGKKIAEGSPDEIRTDNRVIEAYLGKRSEHAPNIES